MQIIVGKTAGFCFGVKNAVIKAKEETKKSKPIYCLGELVHNAQVTEELTEKGIQFVDNIDGVKGRVIIRSHGVTKETYKKAENKNIEIVDLTCPKVLKIHNIAEEYSNKDYYIFLIGNKDHPEVIGTASFCGNNYSIVEETETVEQALLDFREAKKEKILIISQTTYSIEKFNKIVEKIKQEVFSEILEIKNTICNATKERQEETMKLAKQVDMIRNPAVGMEHRICRLRNNAELKKWYKYQSTGIVTGMYDDLALVLGNADFDGDTVCTVDNKEFIDAVQRELNKGHGRLVLKVTVDEEKIYIITAYIPNIIKFEADLKTRRE